MKSPKPLQSLLEYVDLVVEKKVREADVSDGSRVPHGSSKHIKDLEKRIEALGIWRNKQKKGSEKRSEYSRLIARLKGELSSARRAKEKKNVREGVGDPAEEAEAHERWEKLVAGDTPDEAVKAIIRSFEQADDESQLEKVKAAATRRMEGGLLSTVVTAGFLEWLYDRRAKALGGHTEGTF